MATIKADLKYTQPGYKTGQPVSSTKVRSTGMSEADIQNIALSGGKTATAAPNSTVATGSDLMSLWNQAYPNASTADTSTLAKTQADVDNMTIRDRLWDSMKFTYGQQMQESNQSYDQAQSQFNNQQLAKGMQRSSYGAATSANIGNKKIEAQNQIYGQQIADYENRLMEAEQQEEAQRQFNAQLNSQWLEQILKKKGDPSDELLAAVGLSRADYNLMKGKKSSGGGGSSSTTTSSGGKKSTKTNTTGNGDAFGTASGAASSSIDPGHTLGTTMINNKTSGKIGNTGSSSSLSGPINPNLQKEIDKLLGK